MSIANDQRIVPGYEPIEGYVLEQRIGRGGYGEVWRASAPGGIKKAVKFVYGQHDEARAEQELKSLERMKGVQHPFLLTLERFERIENQLVIVTELADGSLEDIYNQHRKRGSCGIPRDALLKYMKDVADALDYLHQRYKLQHLDIKPGNLLIIGGRAKVADFGLLKELGEVECSIVGGLTPIYAPPEVFDGRPSLHSDQYSLAVMYQELLTSTRPFAGRTIAQLATQHVHNAPNLKPLPASDRPVVARALEKSPERRFESCSDFVDKLTQPRGETSVTAVVDPPSDPLEKGAVENLPQLRGLENQISGLENQIRSVDNLTAEDKQTQVLVIALGGTGASALDRLRSRIYDQGAASPLSLQSVLIDTDPETIGSARLVEPCDHVRPCQVVDASLRTAQQYRQRGTGRFKTISRRWIYNVPRNGRTGGMRPLGRLALLDHADEVMATLRSAVSELKASAVDAQHAKVYVVGSLTGGTGSGIYLDVVHLLRHLLDTAAMESAAIVSLLTTARFQGDPSRPLALHATKSALSEIQYFLRPGNGYPGDSGVGWPGVPAARTPLRDAYLISQATTPGAHSPLDSVINYLWCDAGRAGQWLARGRENEEIAGKQRLGIRSVGAVVVGDSDDWQADVLTPWVTRTVLQRWLGNPQDGDDASQAFVARVVRRCGLINTVLSERVQQWFGASQAERRERLMGQLDSFDPVLLKTPSALRSEWVRWLSGAIDLEQAEVAAGQALEQIERELRLRLQESRIDISSSLAGITAVKEHVNSLHQTLMKSSDEQFRRLVATEQREAETNSEKLRRPELVHAACDSAEALLGVIASRVAAAIALTLESKLGEMHDRYAETAARLTSGIEQLTHCEHGTGDPWQAVSEQLRGQLDVVVDRLNLSHVAGQLFRLTIDPNSVCIETMVDEMSSTAAGIVREVAESMVRGDEASGNDSSPKHRRTVSMGSSGAVGDSGSIGDAGAGADPSQSWAGQSERWGKTCLLENGTENATPLSREVGVEATGVPIESAIEAARPVLLDCGGKRRLYLVCRDRRESDLMLSRLPENDRQLVTTITDRRGSPMLVHEAQEIELEQLMTWLDALTGGDKKISSRLATRSDLNWDGSAR